jgi:hypothetical protein
MWLHVSVLPHKAWHSSLPTTCHHMASPVSTESETLFLSNICIHKQPKRLSQTRYEKMKCLSAKTAAVFLRAPPPWHLGTWAALSMAQIGLQSGHAPLSGSRCPPKSFNANWNYAAWSITYRLYVTACQCACQWACWSVVLDGTMHSEETEFGLSLHWLHNPSSYQVHYLLTYLHSNHGYFLPSYLCYLILS